MSRNGWKNASEYDHRSTSSSDIARGFTVLGAGREWQQIGTRALEAERERARESGGMEGGGLPRSVK